MTALLCWKVTIPCKGLRIRKILAFPMGANKMGKLYKLFCGGDQISSSSGDMCKSWSQLTGPMWQTVGPPWAEPIPYKKLMQPINSIAMRASAKKRKG